MKQNYSHITIVIDRSGSMQSIRDEAEGGLNSLIEKQRLEKGEATLTLVQFDDVVEVVHNGLDIRDVPRYNLVPRNMTAMHEGIGVGIVKTGEFLGSLKEEDRPKLVVFVIITDGMANVYHEEFTAKRIAEMIKHQEEKYSWQFTYMGANQDAVQVGNSININSANSATYDVNNVRKVYSMSSDKLSAMRGASISGCSMNDISQLGMYTEEDKAELVN